VLSTIGPQVDARLRPDFKAVGLAYPPERVLLMAFKQERRLDLLAGGKNGPLRLVRSFSILGASGNAGPKRREGDSQVPEGFYHFELLNPNSSFHLSLRVSYPNVDDRKRAIAEGQDLSTLGGDIMIHGNSVSVGCLAMGDSAAEELFVLAARVGLDDIDLVIFPWDLRQTPPPQSVDRHSAYIYVRLQEFLEKLP
jgi:murein L,D-transpeptidase YafK